MLHVQLPWGAICMHTTQASQDKQRASFRIMRTQVNEQERFQVFYLNRFYVWCKIHKDIGYFKFWLLKK